MSRAGTMRAGPAPPLPQQPGSGLSSASAQEAARNGIRHPKQHSAQQRSSSLKIACADMHSACVCAMTSDGSDVADGLRMCWAACVLYAVVLTTMLVYLNTVFACACMHSWQAGRYINKSRCYIHIYSSMFRK